MKSLILPLLTAFLALVNFTNALQSKGFLLSLVSDNSTLDGMNLVACHTGAAIEQPCVLFDSASSGTSLKEFRTFYLNYTEKHPNSGKLIWDLIATGAHNKKIVESEPMSFDYNPGRNIAGMVFLPGGGYQPVAFDSHDMMYISDIKLETQETGFDYTPVRLYRWQMCTITEGDEFYYSLTWLLGNGSPSLPGCQAVGVKRIFKS